MKRNSRLATLGSAALLVAVSLTFGSQQATAADHVDSASVQTPETSIIDIADYFAWHTEDGNVVLIMTYAGLHHETEPDSFLSRDTLHTFNIDTDGNPDPDISIYVRFAQNAFGDWGVQFENVPGSGGTFQGAVGEEITDGGVTATVGVFDDPFFFDLAGFMATSANLGDDGDDADLAFTGADGFAGFNVMAIIIEFPAKDVGAATFQTWGVTSLIDDGGATTSSSGSTGSTTSGA